MVTAPHEALHRFFQEYPIPLTNAFAQVLEIRFPTPKEVSVLNVDLTEIRPVERRADTAMLLETGTGRHVIVVESQTEPDESRKLSWPYYVAYLHNKYTCPVTLLVMTADKRTASWARQPINVGIEEAPSQITRPLVLGPDNVPAITEVDQAHRDVTLAVLSALTHRHSGEVNAILEALVAALDQEDQATAEFLAEFTEIGLGEGPASQIWRALMKTMAYGFESQLHREWREEGREEGRVQEAVATVLDVLEARGLAVPESVARRVNECTDLTILRGLRTRAATVERAEDLFADRIA